jgi:hypothetical protein
VLLGINKFTHTKHSIDKLGLFTMMTQPTQVDLEQFLQDGFICLLKRILEINLLKTDEYNQLIFVFFINFELVVCEKHLDSRLLYWVEKILLSGFD